jgi:hypothetical protein
MEITDINIETLNPNQYGLKILQLFQDHLLLLNDSERNHYYKQIKKELGKKRDSENKLGNIHNFKSYRRAFNLICEYWNLKYQFDKGSFPFQ